MQKKSDLDSILPAELKKLIASFLLSDKDYCTAMQLSKKWQTALKTDLPKRIKSRIENYPSTFPGIHLYESFSTKKEIITTIIDNKDFNELRSLYDYNCNFNGIRGNYQLDRILDRNRIDIVNGGIGSSLNSFGWTIGLAPNKEKIKAMTEIIYIRDKIASFLMSFTNPQLEHIAYLGGHASPESLEPDVNPFVELATTEGTFFADNEAHGPFSIVISSRHCVPQLFLEKLLTALESFGFISKALKIKILMLNAERLGESYECQNEIDDYVKNPGKNTPIDFFAEIAMVTEMRKALTDICDKTDNKGFNRIARKLSEAVEKTTSAPGFGNFSVIDELKKIAANQTLTPYQILKHVQDLLPRAVKYGSFKTDLESFVDHYAKDLSDRSEYRMVRAS